MKNPHPGYFSLDEVPDYLKSAAKECQHVRQQVENGPLRRIGFTSLDQLPTYGVMPVAVIEGQQYLYPQYNHHWRVLGFLLFVARPVNGILVWTGLTESQKQSKLFS